MPPVRSASDPVPPAWRRTFAALGERNFRVFFAGQLVSQTGTWMRSAALGWITLQRTGSEFWLGMISVASTLPLLLISPWAGSIADQRPRLPIFRATTTLALAASSALAVLLFMGRLPTPLIFALATLWGVATAFEMPARQSMVVELAGRRHLVNAIALNSASINATRVVGPAIGGVLLAAFGAAWCFLVDAVTYGVVLASTFLIRMPARAASRRGGSASAHLADGARYVWRHDALRPAMTTLAGMSLFGWAYLSQMAAMAKFALGLGPRGFGFLLAANGLGAVAGALRVATLGDRGNLRRQMRNGVLIFSAGLVAATLPRNPWLAAAGFVVAGFGLVTFFASCNSHVQTHSDDAYRGRVMGLYALVFGGGMPLGSLWLGVAAEHLGVRTALRLAAVLGLLAASAGFALGSRRPKGGR